MKSPVNVVSHRWTGKTGFCQFTQQNGQFDQPKTSVLIKYLSTNKKQYWSSSQGCLH